MKSSLNQSNEEEAGFLNIPVPDIVETKFNQFVDCATVATTHELWDCCPDQKEMLQCLDEMILCNDRDFYPFLPYRNDQDAYSTLSYRDDDSIRTGGDDSTAYSFFLDYAISYFTTGDEESLYSRYSRYTQDTGCPNRSCKTIVEEDESVVSEYDDDFKRIIEALKKHAAVLGISEMELLEILEMKQEELRREQQPKVPLKRTISDQTIYRLVDEAANKKEKRKEGAKSNSEVPEKPGLKRFLGFRAHGFNTHWRNREISRRMFRRVKTTSTK